MVSKKSNSSQEETSTAILGLTGPSLGARAFVLGLGHRGQPVATGLLKEPLGWVSPVGGIPPWQSKNGIPLHGTLHGNKNTRSLPQLVHFGPSPFKEGWVSNSLKWDGPEKKPIAYVPPGLPKKHVQKLGKRGKRVTFWGI